MLCGVANVCSVLANYSRPLLPCRSPASLLAWIMQIPTCVISTPAHSTANVRCRALKGASKTSIQSSALPFSAIDTAGAAAKLPVMHIAISRVAAVTKVFE